MALTGTMVTGELLELDAALNELIDFMNYDTTDEVRYLKPTDTDDPYRTIWYDCEMDEFVDFMGYPIYRNSWIDEHAEWLLMTLQA